MIRFTKLSSASLLLSSLIFGQVVAEQPTRQDVLRGAITPERAWWDVSHYDLSATVTPETKLISGKNIITYRVLTVNNRIQIELQPPMKLTNAIQDGKQLTIEQDGYSYFIKLVKPQIVGSENQLTLEFSGSPHVAIRPPWDAGITWTKDKNGNHFIATTSQDTGASIWWPNKDHAYDEPDNGMAINIEIPKNLVNVANGRLINIEENSSEGMNTYQWQVVNPINNYAINLNIGDYVHFDETFQGEAGELSMDYYVLRDNLTKAKKQFKDAAKTIKAFEHWFGPYPFYEDGFKLIEAPYLGMEHQSAVTYGNDYKQGYKGRDLSSTDWGLTFDFIIIHETGHEWFANNITHNDIADLWIHESFTNYSESLYVEYYHGKDSGAEYVRGTRLNILNDKPIIGQYNQHNKGSKDMYYKGGNMLHTIRQIIDNDALWRNILRGLNTEFRHQTVDASDIEQYIIKRSGKDLAAVFDQYLRDHRLPILEYFIKDKQLRYRWSNSVSHFNMPIKVTVNDKTMWLSPKSEWATLETDQKIKELKIDKNFYVSQLNILGN